VTADSQMEALRRKLAHLESFAKAVGIVCIIFAIYDVFVVVYYTGWAILAKLGAISIPWPFHRPAANIAIALGVPVAVTGLTAGYGLRHLRSWSSWALGAYSIALFLQFGMLVYNDHQSGEPKVALMSLALGAMLLMPVVALWRLDPSSVLSKDYGRAVADSPHIWIRAKLPRGVKCGIVLLVLILIGLAWSM
jgi:hypothetical protein